MMRTIPYEKVLEIYKRLIRESGGVYGVRDEGLLRASLESAFQTFDGIELYPAVVDKIAAVCYNIIKNHPLIDGNKRLGITLMAVLCDINNIPLECSDEELVELGVAIAEGRYDREQIKNWILEHTKKGEENH
ncbi:type II toxin-antitoxin system death-on-curing family toxin [Caldicellulosiruptor naganoensis]|uniref:Type II toxin-antitoxin system death-on-curing family toxin n=1 Tax=Caldicellulosiruptor naganoensis TaxID=29324 RepID=A0ABY7BH42_9FIRM|nr:type II toxin-antitoxin system death-on-curing family toxin [Caldicellulosiruptor naganoensis]WAM31657.1 type II toxin-antitoxin system death-on-curing family toxin [Caldicellulosiruptor naganoensis]